MSRLRAWAGAFRTGGGKLLIVVKMPAALADLYSAGTKWGGFPADHFGGADVASGAG